MTFPYPLIDDSPLFGSVGQRVGFEHQNSLVRIGYSEYLRCENPAHRVLSKLNGIEIV